MNYMTLDGVRYAWEFTKTTVTVYDEAGDEKLVEVAFDHDSENATVYGAEFEESAPYFELVDKNKVEVAEWAVYQIPGY